MEVGIVALGLGALGLHFGNKDKESEQPKEKFLDNTNSNNNQTIYILIMKVNCRLKQS